ncbi:MAG: tyrosine-type recombinase/integrase [Pyrinomonadaceae bacterium]
MGVYLDKKTKRFRVKFDYQGHTYTFRLPAGTTRKQAEELETKKKHELFFESHRMVDAADILYEDFAADVYLPFVEANRSSEHFKNAVRIIRDSLAFLKGRPVRAIRPADIERFKTHRMRTPKKDGRPRNPATVDRELNVVSALFTRAVKNGVCDTNPCSAVERPAYDNIQDRVLPPGSEERFFAAFKSDWARDVCRVIIHTGLRQNDILGLRRRDVDLDAGEITIVQGKTRKSVRLPVNDTALDVIRRWMSEHPTSEWVFPSPKTGGRGTSVKKAMRTASDDSGLGRIGTRVLRRTFGTRLHELGWDDMTVAGLLGHRDLRSVHRYKRGTEIKRRAVQSLENGKGEESSLNSNRNK